MAIISKTYSKILATLLSLLGFSAVLVSCVKYGGLSNTYKAKGVVVSETNDAPIEGIRAILKYDNDYELDVAYTNNKGVFNLQTYDGFDKLYVELTDVDGEKNDSFNDTVVVADFSHVKFKGSSKTRSEVENDLGIIKLEPKK